MISFSDAHFHSILKCYENSGIDFTRIYKSLYMGIDCSTSLDDVETITDKIALFPNIFTTIGSGPWQVYLYSDDFLSEIEKTVIKYKNSKQVIAIGEIGLDYHYDYPVERQKKLFVRQVELSLEYDFPLVLHIRDSFDDVFDILRGYHLKYQGMVHCFSSGRDEARKALDMGFYLSFGGSATYRKNSHIREALSYCPQDRVLLETDSPYLAPEGKRGEVNIPLNVADIGNILSAYRDKSENIFNKTNDNIRRFVCQRSE